MFVDNFFHGFAEVCIQAYRKCFICWTVLNFMVHLYLLQCSFFYICLLIVLTWLSQFNLYFNVCLSMLWCNTFISGKGEGWHLLKLLYMYPLNLFQPALSQEPASPNSSGFLLKEVIPKPYRLILFTSHVWIIYSQFSGYLAQLQLVTWLHITSIVTNLRFIHWFVVA